ncbi:unnamed protein product [Pedinophyceae sp. YPF-701]|nr:unnamed protein product [Pedinophyceae sp. YPF-701]
MAGPKDPRTDEAERANLNDKALKRLDRQKFLQEQLTDELVTLAGRLRQNAFAVHSTVQERGACLEDADKALEASHAGVTKLNAKTHARAKRQSVGLCTQLLVMLLVIAVFLGTLVFIRATYFFGYRAGRRAPIRPNIDHDGHRAFAPPQTRSAPAPDDLRRAERARPDAAHSEL